MLTAPQGLSGWQWSQTPCVPSLSWCGQHEVFRPEWERSWVSSQSQSQAMRTFPYASYSSLEIVHLSLRHWLPRWLSGKESACKSRRCRQHGLDPWVRKIPWRRTWQPTPVFLPGESHGQRSLAGYSPRGGIESDTTEHSAHTHTHTLKQTYLSFKQWLGQNEMFQDVPNLKLKVKLLSRVWLLATPGTVAHQAPLPMGFSRQEY